MSVRYMNAIRLTNSLVAEWLKDFMFKDDPEREHKANEIARAFGDSHRHLSHSRMIGIDQAVALGLRVRDIREDPELYRRVWDVYMSITHTFDGTGAVKIVENHLGECVVLIAQNVAVRIPIAPAREIGEPSDPPGQPAPRPNRQQRRHPNW